MNKAKACFFLSLIFTSCSVSKQVAKQAEKTLLNDSALSNAHVGISVFEPATGRYWYNYQAERYFVPASNTKLFSLYAGMRFLGDSLPAARYADSKDTLFIIPTGDPTLLHPDFRTPNFFNFLKSSGKTIAIINNNWKENALGPGWSWDDYNDDYMVERSSLPVYGNVINWVYTNKSLTGVSKQSNTVISQPAVQWKSIVTPGIKGGAFFVKRHVSDNIFDITMGEDKSAQQQQVPFITDGITSAAGLLKDTLHTNVIELTSTVSHRFSSFYSLPSDSLYKKMMYRSDNFFAEQVLLMASNEVFGVMNDEKIIDSILNADLKDMPQKPRWADGSGLSRYNLFSPGDFVYILNKMKNDFGLERLKNILPTGGTGTLKTYYLKDSSYIYAKTGTLSNVAALSGFLITKKNRLLIFSILGNNFITTATAFRKASEKFLTGLRQRY